MVNTVDNAALRRAMREREYQQQQAARGWSPEPVPKMLRRPSGLGVQIDAMIENLKAEGHSPENIARVFRLRADKMEGKG